MRRRLARAAAGFCAMLLAVTCGAGSGDLDGSAAPADPDAHSVVTPGPRESTVALPADPAEAWWPVSSSTQLTPTGIVVVASAAVDAMVVDGAGAAWLHSVGKVTRVDPSTGSARSWDLGDDTAFGTATELRASGQSGVWLVSGERLRLFDGHRFVRDLPVPAEFRGGDGAGITDMVEVGSEVWVSSTAGVARCATGAWSMVGAGQLTHVRTLAAEPAGHVWAAGLASSGLSAHTTVARFDGSRWSTQPSAPPSAGTIVADPTGGVLRQLGVELHRFDGLAWRRLPDIQGLPGQPSLPVAPAISPTGVVWLRGADFLAKQVSGRWRRVVDDTSRDLVQVAFTDLDVLVADSRGLLRVVGDRLRRVWLDQDSWLGAPPVRLLALSSDEAWAISARGSEPDAVMRFSDGRWQQMLPGASPVGLTVGTDGGVWVSTVDGLVRFSGGQWEAVDASPQAASLLAGPDGAVWVPQPASHMGCWSDEGASGPHLDFRQLALVEPEGQRATVRLPVGDGPVTSILAGADGSVWTTTCGGGLTDHGPRAPTLMLWNETWSPVPYPGRSITGVAGDPLGGFWAWLTADAARARRVLAHYVEGTWTQYPQVPDLIAATPTPGGSICGIEARELALLCVDASGRITTAPVGVPAEPSIGLDGSIWLTDPDGSGVVARLPGTMPG